MSEIDDAQVFQLIGEEGFSRLTAGFYRRVSSDPILAPMYPDNDFEGAEVRLRDFLVFRFGGPTRYLEQRGHPRLRMRHAPFPITQAARDRWIKLMDEALAEAELPQECSTVLHGFFDHAATFLINQPAS